MLGRDLPTTVEKQSWFQLIIKNLNPQNFPSRWGKGIQCRNGILKFISCWTGPNKCTDVAYKRESKFNIPFLWSGGGGRVAHIAQSND